LWLACPLAASADPSLGSLDFHPRGISADGGTVVGSLGNGAVRWSAASGIESLPVPSPDCDSSFAEATSGDGGVTLGAISCAGAQQGFVWTASGSVVTFVAPPFGGCSLSPGGISRDGASIATGECAGDFAVAAGRTFDGSTVSPAFGLDDDLFAPPEFSSASAVSEDGAVFVGGGAHGPVRWTPATGPVALEVVDGVVTRGSARATSPDGSRLVGGITQPGTGASAAFRWNASDGASLLGPGAAVSSIATALSDDGNAVVGEAEFVQYQRRAFWWTPERGLRDLKTVLERHLGARLDGWTFETAAISANGLTLAGSGVTPLGETGWIATLEPDCANGADDDGDGLADLADPGCVAPQDFYEGALPQCDDGLDNDRNGLADFPADPNCRSGEDTTELATCGLGPELAALLPLLGWLRRRRTRRS
jgi:uncharacterized membrane protein